MIRRRRPGIGADDQLGGRGFTCELAPVVVDETGFQAGHLIGGHPPQSLLIAADRRHLGDHGLEPPVGGAQHQRMPAGIAGAPQTDSVGVHAGMGLQVGDGIAPVGDLAPGVDVEARQAVTDPEPAVIVYQHHEPGIGEHPREPV